MKRKNCSISVQHAGRSTAAAPATTTPPGACAAPTSTATTRASGAVRGASADWSDDTYRGDGPGAEPESRQRPQAHLRSAQVTVMITNHTYSNLVLRPPPSPPPGSPRRAAVQGARRAMADANGYANEPSYQLYDTSGSTEDWSYWNTGGYGFTFEIGDEGFHPAYEDAVVGGVPRAAAGRRCRAGRQPRGVLPLRDRQPRQELPLHDHGHGAARPAADGAQAVHLAHLTGDRGRLRPGPTEGPDRVPRPAQLVAGHPRAAGSAGRSTRPRGRWSQAAAAARPQAPAQPTSTLTNPAGVPAEGESEFATFTITGLPTYDNGRAAVTVSWPGVPGDEALDWDVFVYNSAGDLVGQAATLADPEVASLIDPVPGTYTVEVNNYQGGTAATDWSGKVVFEQPKPPVVTGRQGGLDDDLREEERRRGRQPAGRRRPGPERRRGQRLQAHQALIAG